MKKILLMICLFVFLPALAQAVDFTFTDLDGKNYKSGDLKGSPVVINVGAHW